MTPQQLRRLADEAERHPDPAERVVYVRIGGRVHRRTPAQARAAADRAEQIRQPA